jgi:hypothetical protein
MVRGRGLTMVVAAAVMAGAVVLGVVGGGTRAAWAWDALDGDQTSMEVGADITDLYAWMSPDGARVFLILNVTKGAAADAKFPTNVQYVLHTASRPSAKAPEGARPVDVICTFDAAQAISCWAGGDHVTGDASAPAGIASESGRLRVFAGPRNDPFFMNKAGWDVFAEIVHRGNRPSGYTLDGAGCPTITPERSQRALADLTFADERGSTGFDAYASLNVQSIVLSIDKRLLTRDGPIVSVWGSTNRAP